MVAGVVSQCGGDVIVAGQSEQAEHGIAQRCHHLRASGGSDLRVILGVGDVANPVQAVLDVPVSAQPVGDLAGLGIGRGQRSDGVDGLGGALACLAFGDRASQLEHLHPRVGTRCPGRSRSP